jgi:hypothetical protein
MHPRAIALLFVLLFGAACIPVLTHQLPPFADYANHLARIHVINTIDKDPFLSRFYEIEWEIIPNLMIDLVLPLFNRFMDIYAAGQLFTVLSFLLIVSGTVAFHRAVFGQWSAVPLFSVMLLYNGVLLVGVMNYVFGIGLALWALAGWLFLRERSLPLRLAVSAVFAVALFFCHLFAVGLYGLGLLAIELHRLWEWRSGLNWRRLLDFAATGLPFAPLLVLMATGPTVASPGHPAYWEFWGKLEGLEIALTVYYPEVGFGIVAVLAIAAFLGFRAGVLHFHPLGWFLLGVGGLVYLAMPRAIFAAHLADQRLPIALAFMLIACFQLELRTRLVQRAFVTLLFAVVVVSVTEVQAVWNELSPRTQEFLNSVRTMERGSRVLVVHGSGGGEDKITNADIMHAASLATIERSALVTTAFTVPGKHILQVREQYKRFVETEDRWPPSLPYFLEVAERGSPARKHFWELWPRHYDYVYILFTRQGWRCPDRKHLTLVHDGEGFQLYRVNNSNQAGGTPGIDFEG